MRTRSVDVTISNILEGVVTYTPQPVETTPLPSTSSVPETKNIPSTSIVTPSTSSSTSVLFIDIYKICVGKKGECF